MLMKVQKIDCPHTLNKMIRAVIRIFLSQVSILMIGQNNNTNEIQGGRVDSTSNSELQVYTNKFNNRCLYQSYRIRGGISSAIT